MEWTVDESPEGSAGIVSRTVPPLRAGARTDRRVHLRTKGLFVDHFRPTDLSQIDDEFIG